MAVQLIKVFMQEPKLLLRLESNGLVHMLQANLFSSIRKWAVHIVELTKWFSEDVTYPLRTPVVSTLSVDAKWVMVVDTQNVPAAKLTA